jgi:hypothetical protein
MSKIGAKSERKKWPPWAVTRRPDNKGGTKREKLADGLPLPVTTHLDYSMDLGRCIYVVMLIFLLYPYLETPISGRSTQFRRSPRSLKQHLLDLLIHIQQIKRLAEKINCTAVGGAAHLVCAITGGNKDDRQGALLTKLAA